MGNDRYQSEFFSQFSLMFIFVAASTLAIGLMARAAAGKASSAKKRNSPTKKKLTTPKAKGRIKTSYIIRCITFDSYFPFEMYIFEKVGINRDGYLHRLRKHVENEEAVEYLNGKGFNQIVPRRVPQSDNVIMVGNNGYWRNVIIRYPKDEDDETIETTEETREEGLALLKRFVCDPNFSQYYLTPDQVTTIDETDPENIPSLDTYFTDQNIRLIMMHHIEETDLTNTFVQRYPELAQNCWSGNHISEWAQSLGFGNANNPPNIQN